MHRGQQPAIVELDRSLVAQHLLDRRGKQRGIGAEASQLGGVAQQKPQAIANEVGGGLMTCIEEEDALMVELGFREPVAILVGLQETREDVDLWVPGM